MLRRSRVSLCASVCVALTLCWLAAGCGGGGGDEGSSSSATSGGGGSGTGGGGGTGGGKKADGGKSGPAAKAEGWGTLTGRITLVGDVPELPPLVKQGDKEVKDAEHCAVGNVPNETLVVDGETKGIRDVFVYLLRKPDEIHPDLEEPTQKLVDFDQKECRFLNHAMSVRLDQTLVLKNSDPMPHNTNISGGPAGSTNPQLPSGAEQEFSFSRSRPVPVPVACNIHSWMKAWILPSDHPYVAVTNEKGEFTIENVPAGIELEFRVWQEAAGYVNSADGSITKGNLSVTVEADGTTTRDIEVDVSAFKLN